MYSNIPKYEYVLYSKSVFSQFLNRNHKSKASMCGFSMVSEKASIGADIFVAAPIMSSRKIGKTRHMDNNKNYL